MTDMKRIEKGIFPWHWRYRNERFGKILSQTWCHHFRIRQGRDPINPKTCRRRYGYFISDEVVNKKDRSRHLYNLLFLPSSTLRKYFADSKVPMLKRSQVLGNISDSERTIAIAGTHGKTTTTAMTTHILFRCGIKVTGFVRNYDQL